jgi:hypothetical protein
MFSWLPTGVQLMTDVTAADWIIERLRPWDPSGARLESFAPEGFEAYGRIFHPPGLRLGRVGDRTLGSLKWADLARARDLAVSSDISFSKVSGIASGNEGQLDKLGPDEGNLAPGVCDALASVLRRHTSSEDCWYCLWEGNGAFWSESHSILFSPDATRAQVRAHRAAGRAQDKLLASTPRVEARARSYFLFHGPLEAACSFEPSGWYTSPNMWWPGDHAWVVITEVDGFSSYFCCTQEALNEVLEAGEIEAIEVTLDVHMDPGAAAPRWR